MRTRFVGGPLHGHIKDIPREYPIYEVPLPREFPAYTRPEDIYATSFRTAIYERRKVAFGMFAAINVMAHHGMSEAHFMRAVADIVEGVA